MYTTPRIELAVFSMAFAGVVRRLWGFETRFSSRGPKQTRERVQFESKHPKTRCLLPLLPAFVALLGHFLNIRWTSGLNDPVER